MELQIAQRIDVWEVLPTNTDSIIFNWSENGLKPGQQLIDINTEYNCVTINSSFGKCNYAPMDIHRELKKIGTLIIKTIKQP